MARGTLNAAMFIVLLNVTLVAVYAQTSAESEPTVRRSQPDALIIEGVNTSDIFGIGRDVVVRGTVTQGVLVLGGDLFIEGRVEGDVATIGGSVVQREGAYIGGDVVVIGGAYNHGARAPERNPQSTTVMIARFETELREAARNPASLLAPRFTLASFGIRLVSVMFWFLASLALTAAAPGAIGRAAARLQLTSVRVGLIGLAGAIVLAISVLVSLRFLPTALGAFVLIVALLLLVVSHLFGRTAIHAVTGRWLQRILLPQRGGHKHSEAMALLLGAIFWAIILSLPYVWPLIVAGLFIASLGLSFTARSQMNWKQS